MVRSFSASKLIRSSRSYSVSGQTPQAALRKIYLRLQDPDTMAELSPYILETLKRASADESSQLELLIADAEVTADFRRRFCGSLYTHIFGSHTLRSQRLQVSLSTFCEVRAYYGHANIVADSVPVATEP